MVSVHSMDETIPSAGVESLGKNNRNSFLGVSKTWFLVPTGRDIENLIHREGSEYKWKVHII